MRKFGGNLWALVAACAAVPGLWGGSVDAQDLTYSNAGTEACVYAQPGHAAQQACVGVSANACMADSDMGDTTVGMSGCLSYELDYWDARLNTAYRSLMKRAKSQDAEMRELGSSAPSLEQGLREMQRAWIPWRDSTCDFERAQWGGGTGGGPATYSCLLRLTGAQALYLEHTPLQ